MELMNFGILRWILLIKSENAKSNLTGGQIYFDVVFLSKLSKLSIEDERGNRSKSKFVVAESRVC